MCEGVKYPHQTAPYPPRRDKCPPVKYIIDMAKLLKTIAFENNEGKILAGSSRKVGVLSISTKAWVDVDNLDEVVKYAKAHKGDLGELTGLSIQSEQYTDKHGVQHTTKVWR